MNFAVGTPVKMTGKAPMGSYFALSNAARSRRTACRPSRPAVVRPRAEVLWSLQPSPAWLEKAHGVFPSDVGYPVHLTELMNKKRPGPNKNGIIRIGMAPSSADLAVTLEGVGAVDVEIEEDGDTGELFISDLGSEPGTFVNNQRIDSKKKLCPGDLVSFGPDQPEFVMTRNIVAHA